MVQPLGSISGPPRCIRSHQRSLDLFQNCFGDRRWHRIGHLFHGSRQITTERVIGRESLQASRLPHRATVLPAVVVRPILTGRDGAMPWPVGRVRWCPVLDTAFCSAVREEVVWGAVFEAVDGALDGVPWLQVQCRRISVVCMCGLGEVGQRFALADDGSMSVSACLWHNIWRRICCDLPRCYQEQALPLLRHAEVRAFQYSPSNAVGHGGQGVHHCREEVSMPE